MKKKTGISLRRILSSSFSVMEPKENRIFFIAALGILSSLFLLVFQPYGIRFKYIQFFYLIRYFGYGALASFIIYLFEFPIRDKVVKISNWTLGKFIIWAGSEIFVVSLFMLFLFCIYNGWANFVLTEWLEFLGNTTITWLMIFGATLGYLKVRILKKINAQLTVDSINSKGSKETLVTIQGDNKHEFLKIPIADLLFLESRGNYVIVSYLKNSRDIKTFMIRKTLKKLEAQLSEFKIFRCHKSFLVNGSQKLVTIKREGRPYLLFPEVDITIPVSQGFTKTVLERVV